MMRIQFRGQEIDGRLAELTGADGLDGSCMEVSVEGFAAISGGRVTGARLGPRTVRLDYAIVGDDPEEARRRVYDVFRLIRPGTLRVDTDAMSVTAQAYVSGIECGLWSRRQEMEVTLTCPDPWLYSRQERTFQRDGATQWTVRNDGEEVGFVAEVGRSGYIRIAGETDRLAWDATALAPSGTNLTVDTREGHRDLYYMDGTARVSCLSCVTEWAWPTFPHGDGYVRSTAAAGPLTIRERWGGL